MISVYDRCAFTGCHRNKFDDSSTQLHRFPSIKDPRFQEWINNCGNPRLATLSPATVRNYGICSDHFRDNCFLNSDKLKLKWNAVPVPYARNQQCANPALTSRVINPESNCNSVPHPQTSTLRDDFDYPDDVRDDVCRTAAVRDLPTLPEIVGIGKGDEDISGSKLRVYGHNRLTFDDSFKDDMDWISIEPDPVATAEKVNETVQRRPATGRKKSCIDKRRQIQINMRKKIRRLQDIITSLRTENRQLRSKLERFHRKEKVTKTRITVDEFLNQKKCFSPAARAMVKLQLHKRNAPYAQDEKDLAKQLYYHSAAAFVRLRKGGCNFPAKSTMQMWIAEYDITTGFCDVIFEELSDKLSAMPTDERVCALKWDEMSIKNYEEYSTKFDMIEGLVDLGPLGRRHERAKHIFVFCVDSLNARNPWRQPLAYFLPGTAMTAVEISSLVQLCIQKLKDAGANVKLLVCDQGTSNQQAYNSFFKVTPEIPLCQINDIEIYASFDFPHLVKRLLSQFRKHKLLYCNGKVIAAYKDFEDTWFYDRANGTSNLLSHISEAHLHPNGFEAMNVKRAFQLLSRTYASAIKLAGTDENGLKSTTWEATADFTETMDRVIDACNSYKLIFRNPHKRPLSPRNPEIEELLTDFIDWSSRWSISPLRLQRAPCLRGFPLTVRAILDVYKSITVEHSGFELAAGLCYQDSVEHLFSKLRQRGGHNPNPTARMVRLSIRHILSTGYIYGSARANVECSEAQSLLNPVTSEVARAFEVANESAAFECQQDIEETSEECDFLDTV